MMIVIWIAYIQLSMFLFSFLLIIHDYNKSPNIWQQNLPNVRKSCNEHFCQLTLPQYAVSSTKYRPSFPPVFPLSYFWSYVLARITSSVGQNVANQGRKPGSDRNHSLQDKLKQGSSSKKEMQRVMTLQHSLKNWKEQLLKRYVHDHSIINPVGNRCVLQMIKSQMKCKLERQTKTGTG